MYYKGLNVPILKNYHSTISRGFRKEMGMKAIKTEKDKGGSNNTNKILNENGKI